MKQTLSVLRFPKVPRSEHFAQQPCGPTQSSPYIRHSQAKDSIYLSGSSTALDLWDFPTRSGRLDYINRHIVQYEKTTYHDKSSEKGCAKFNARGPGVEWQGKKGTYFLKGHQWYKSKRRYICFPINPKRNRLFSSRAMMQMTSKVR